MISSCPFTWNNGRFPSRFHARTFATYFFLLLFCCFERISTLHLTISLLCVCCIFSMGWCILFVHVRINFLEPFHHLVFRCTCSTTIYVLVPKRHGTHAKKRVAEHTQSCANFTFLLFGISVHLLV